MESVNNDLLLDLGLSTQQATSSDRISSGDDLGINEFLELMLAQIENQDPFEPQTSGEFISQLAEFGTVSGIESLDQSFSELSNSMLSSQALYATELIGHTVQIATNVTVAQAGQGISGVVELPQSGTAVQLSIVDQQGSVVQQLSLGDQQAGPVSFSWDGITATGELAPAGQYQVIAEALIDGQAVGLTTMLDVQVESVVLGGAGQPISINLNNGQTVGLDDIQNIQ